MSETDDFTEMVYNACQEITDKQKEKLANEYGLTGEIDTKEMFGVSELNAK